MILYLSKGKAAIIRRLVEEETFAHESLVNWAKEHRTDGDTHDLAEAKTAAKELPALAAILKELDAAVKS